jgi:hypothetical protein
MQRSVRCKHGSCIKGDRFALQVRERAARFADDDRQRRDIQNVDVRFNDHFERTARERLEVTD